jgi:hypothetical protein
MRRLSARCSRRCGPGRDAGGPGRIARALTRPAFRDVSGRPHEPSPRSPRFSRRLPGGRAAFLGHRPGLRCSGRRGTDRRRRSGVS